ncbi:hypothetical protein BB561_005925 [Smittium simulii]|uniref:Vacuolar protein sorting-associated protein 29 n=1 Tax=Smittium simulii TaxID=133385 RepID=A0A2T9Y7J8_9FUNG|nr:hypothetical protein BB561_005925 [Smittium simulii]
MVLGDYDELYDLSATKPTKSEQKENASTLKKPFPDSKIVEIENFKIGIIHGHQLSPPDGKVDTLASVARYMDVDVLCSGNTHRFVAYEEDGKFFINPGSATGASSAYENNPTPSFVLLDIKENNMVVYFYQLTDEVIVDRIEYSK